VDLFCVTDHDTLPDTLPVVADSSMQILAGIELSAQWRGQVVHVLGLNLSNQPDSSLAHGVAVQRRLRDERGQAIGERLRKRGIEDAYAGARRIAGQGVLGRPHFARFLLEQGKARSMDDAFQRWLRDGVLGGSKTSWASLADAVRWINEDGGSAVLAHPAKYQLTHSRLRELVGDFKTAGGTALEVACGFQSPNTTRDLAELCRRYGMLASAGSDFHGGEHDHARLGQPGPLPSDLAPVWSGWSLA
jgi:predicted metal-dependent phosphoesterase TrpH